MNEFAVVIIPFLGTALGSAMVFFMRAKMNSKLEKLLLGFASGSPRRRALCWAWGFCCFWTA